MHNLVGITTWVPSSYLCYIGSVLRVYYIEQSYTPTSLKQIQAVYSSDPGMGTVRLPMTP